MSSLPWVKLTTETGYSWETSVSANTTKKDAENYFLGNTFEVAERLDEERLERVVKVEYHPAGESDD